MGSGCWDSLSRARERISLVIKYGRPTTAAINMRNGFFEGAGWPLGRSEEFEEERPWKEAKAEGVREVASAGGGRPVILAKRVRK